VVAEKLCVALGRQDQIVPIRLDSRLPNDALLVDSRNQIQAGGAAKHLSDDVRFGFALAFGGPTANEGPTRAKVVMERLVPLLPDKLSELQFRGYWAGEIHDNWTVSVELFPLVQVTC
jgi:hypothetical protein